MKIPYLFRALFCALSVIASACGSESVSAGHKASSAYFTSLDRWQIKDLERRFGDVDQVFAVSDNSATPSFSDRMDRTFVGSLIGTIDEIKRRQGLIDLSALGISGTARIDGGLVWQVSPHTLRGIGSFHGGTGPFQTYAFRDGYDLKVYIGNLLIRKPIERLGKLLSRLNHEDQ